VRCALITVDGAAGDRFAPPASALPHGVVVRPAPIVLERARQECRWVLV